MPKKNIICLCVDRLRAAALGAYGNTAFDTASLDRLAGESFVFDQAIVDSPHLATLYRSLWQGRHAIQAESAADSEESLIDAFRAAGWTTALVTDEVQVARLPLAESFEHCRLMPSDDDGDDDRDNAGTHLAGGVADQIDQTQIARLFAEVAGWLDATAADGADASDESEPFMLWVHAQAMAGPWDAPLELRNSLVEADEPPPPQHACGPCELLAKDYDPDEVHGYGCAYAGQVMVLDTCVGALMDLLGERSLLDDTLVMLMGLRGFPLGEHGRLGDVDAALFGELVHVPWLIRMPDGAGAMCRSQALVQPPDLCATLRDWSQIDLPPPSFLAQSLLPLVRGEPAALRDHIAVVDGNRQRALRTPAWYLRQIDDNAAGDQREGGELFIKPDDRWEQNEIASRCRDVVDQLGDVLVQFERSAAASPPAEPPPLAEVLWAGFD